MLKGPISNLSLSLSPSHLLAHKIDAVVALIWAVAACKPRASLPPWIIYVYIVLYLHSSIKNELIILHIQDMPNPPAVIKGQTNCLVPITASFCPSTHHSSLCFKKVVKSCDDSSVLRYDGCGFMWQQCDHLTTCQTGGSAQQWYEVHLKTSD